MGFFPDLGNLIMLWLSLWKHICMNQNFQWFLTMWRIIIVKSLQTNKFALQNWNIIELNSASKFKPIHGCHSPLQLGEFFEIETFLTRKK
jgi:hypothetical protein